MGRFLCCSQRYLRYFHHHQPESDTESAQSRRRHNLSHQYHSGRHHEHPGRPRQCGAPLASPPRRTISLSMARQRTIRFSISTIPGPATCCSALMMLMRLVSWPTPPAPSMATLGVGIQENILTRSGTNQFHGNAVCTGLTNSDLNANQWFNNLTATPEAYANANQGGAGLGGPIIKNKMFFFVNLRNAALCRHRRPPRWLFPTLLIKAGR